MVSGTVVSNNDNYCYCSVVTCFFLKSLLSQSMVWPGRMWDVGPCPNFNPWTWTQPDEMSDSNQKMIHHHQAAFPHADATFTKDGKKMRFVDTEMFESLND